MSQYIIAGKHVAMRDVCACRVESIVEHLLLVNPNTPVLLLAILAMADVQEPDESGVFPWPNKFTPATNALNEAFELMASRHDGLHYADCHEALLSRGVGLFLATALSTASLHACSLPRSDRVSLNIMHDC